MVSRKLSSTIFFPTSRTDDVNYGRSGIFRCVYVYLNRCSLCAMNQLVQLVNEWGAFEEHHPDATAEEFCRHYLISHREKISRREMAGGIVPPNPRGLLLKLSGRIMQAFFIYARIAISETELKSFEGFPYLNALKHRGESSKTEVINHNLAELSTGIEILKRLKKQGMITERQDPEDGRSRLVKISPKGEQVLQQCYEKLRYVTEMIFDGTADDDIQLCIQLLKQVEVRHARLAVECKGKSLSQAYEYVTGKKMKKSSQ